VLVGAECSSGATEWADAWLRLRWFALFWLWLAAAAHHPYYYVVMRFISSIAV
jgi:hypothetical protein